MSKPLPNALRSLSLTILFCMTGALGHAAVSSEPTDPTKVPGRYEIRDPQSKRESIFDITFGPPPPMATERGILIINAFNDLNGNQIQDDNELALIEEISCRLDGIDYLVPAFIPGLGYNDSYSLQCDGERYHPSGDTPEVFIEKRGQVIHLKIPCQTRLLPLRDAN